MGHWPHCPNGHGPLEVERDEQTGQHIAYECPDCRYEISKAYIKKQRERYPPPKERRQNDQ